MLARAVSTAFATPAAAPNTASPPGSARSRPGSARHVASPTRSDRPLPGPHAQIDGRSAAHMPSQPRSAALRQPVARQRPSVLRSGRDRRTTGLHGPSCRPRTSLRAGLRPAAGPACRLSAACADRSGTPGTPTPAPRSVPGGANAGLGTYGRACVAQKFQKENQREGTIAREANAPCRRARLAPLRLAIGGAVVCYRHHGTHLYRLPPRGSTRRRRGDSSQGDGADVWCVGGSADGASGKCLRRSTQRQTRRRHSLHHVLWSIGKATEPTGLAAESWASPSCSAWVRRYHSAPEGGPPRACRPGSCLRCRLPAFLIDVQCGGEAESKSKVCGRKDLDCSEKCGAEGNVGTVARRKIGSHFFGQPSTIVSMWSLSWETRARASSMVRSSDLPSSMTILTVRSGTSPFLIVTDATDVSK